MQRGVRFFQKLCLSNNFNQKSTISFLSKTYCYLATTSPLPHLYLGTTSLLPRCYLAAASLLPRCYLAATSLLPRCYLAATSLLPQCYPNTWPVSLGHSWGGLGAVLDRLRAVLGTLGAVGGCLGIILGDLRVAQGGLGPPWELLGWPGALLGAAWDLCLGRLEGHIGCQTCKMTKNKNYRKKHRTCEIPTDIRARRRLRGDF